MVAGSSASCSIPVQCWQEFLLYRVHQLRKERQRLLLRHALDEFRQWLRRQAHSFHFVTKIQIRPHSSQHDEASAIALVRGAIEPHDPVIALTLVGRAVALELV
jgi:hypothetical protein